MKFKDFLENLEELLEDHPEVTNYEVIYSTDEEGNEYFPVYFDPSIGRFEKDSGLLLQFTGIEEFKDLELDDSDANAVCIN